MEEVIVTGSKLPQTPGNVTQKISIITADEMSSLVLGNGNLAEMLSYTPGNFANVLSRNDANWGSSGGLAHTYKGYMLDGLPIDAFVDLQSLDSWAFQRVEDQRGSASVLYPTYLAMDFAGNQSPLAGTANFILKERVRSTRTSASVYGGSYSTIGGRFFHQRAAGNLHLFFGGHHEDSDYTDYGTEGSWLQMDDNPEYEKTKLYMRGTYYLDDSGQRASLYAHRTWHTGDAGRINRDFGHTYTTLNAGYTRPISDRMTANAKVGYRDYVRRWEEDGIWEDPKSRELRSEDGVDQSVIPADLSVSVITRESDVLTVGADYQLASYATQRETGETSPGNDATATALGLYAQEEFRLDNITLRAGARYTTISHDIELLQGMRPERGQQFLGQAPLQRRGALQPERRPRPCTPTWAPASRPPPSSRWAAPCLRTARAAICPTRTSSRSRDEHRPGGELPAHGRTAGRRARLQHRPRPIRSCRSLCRWRRMTRPSPRTSTPARPRPTAPSWRSPTASATWWSGSPTTPTPTPR